MSLVVGVVTDLHYTTDDPGDLAFHGPFDVAGVLPRLAGALEWFAAAGADVVVVAGDLTNEGDPESLETVVRALTAGWAGHVEIVPGNHDVLRSEDALRQAATDRVRALEPAGRLLQGIRLAGVGWDVDACVSRVAEWADEPTVLVSHFPLISRAAAFAEQGKRYAGDRPETVALLEALSARPAPTLVITGHLHAADHVQAAQVSQLTVAALVEPPFEAALISVQACRGSLHVHRRARYLGRC